MGGSVRPVITVDYTMKGGYFAGSVSALHAQLIAKEEQAISRTKGMIRDPYIMEIIRDQLNEREKQKKKENKEKLKELMKKTGKTEKQLLTDWARNHFYTLEMALSIFGGREGLIDVLVNRYSY